MRLPEKVQREMAVGSSSCSCAYIDVACLSNSSCCYPNQSESVYHRRNLSSDPDHKNQKLIFLSNHRLPKMHFSSTFRHACKSHKTSHIGDECQTLLPDHDQDQLQSPPPSNISLNSTPYQRHLATPYGRPPFYYYAPSQSIVRVKGDQEPQKQQKEYQSRR